MPSDLQTAKRSRLPASGKRHSVHEWYSTSAALSRAASGKPCYVQIKMITYKGNGTNESQARPWQSCPNSLSNDQSVSKTAACCTSFGHTGLLASMDDVSEADTEGEGSHPTALAKQHV
ncbi:hypothetical protein ABBQ32_011221 [Trebouxia sp. C0010 RCD-2024]